MLSGVGTRAPICPREAGPTVGTGATGRPPTAATYRAAKSYPLLLQPAAHFPVQQPPASARKPVHGPGVTQRHLATLRPGALAREAVNAPTRSGAKHRVTIPAPPPPAAPVRGNATHRNSISRPIPARSRSRAADDRPYEHSWRRGHEPNCYTRPGVRDDRGLADRVRIDPVPA